MVSTLKADVLLKQERLLQKSFEHNSGFSKICDFFLKSVLWKTVPFSIVTWENRYT